MSKINLAIKIIITVTSISCFMHNTIKSTKNKYFNLVSRTEATKSFTYLALGDSYTIGEGVLEEMRFPVQLAHKLNEGSLLIQPPEIIAKTGWTTSDLIKGLNDLSPGKNFSLVSLLIGVNNQYQGKDTAEYRLQFKELLQKSIEFAGGEANKVIVISIPDYSVTPFAEQKNRMKIAGEIEFFNKINFAETKKAGANYINITPISRKAKDTPGLLASDGLHPSGEMYRLWMEEIFPLAKNIIQNK